jgi:hypothetical protein
MIDRTNPPKEVQIYHCQRHEFGTATYYQDLRDEGSNRPRHTYLVFGKICTIDELESVIRIGDAERGRWASKQ